MTLLRILLLEDSLLDTELIQMNLINGGIDGELVRVETRTDFLRALEVDSFDLILSDYSLPSFDGISALEIAQATCPEVPFIFVSATLGEELAIETLKSGAIDYVLKQRLDRLAPAVKRALREAEERLERQRAESELRQLTSELERRVEERTAELAKANEALLRSESTLRSYFELPLIGIAISSPDKGWLEANDKLCDIFGYDRHELTAMTWVELTHPEDWEADVEQFNQLVAGTIEGYSLDKRFICKNGQVIYASLSTRCVRRADKSIDYLVTIVQDITERKQAEEALRLSDEVLTQMPDAVLVTDLEGNIQKWMGKAEQIFGYTAEEAIGKPATFLHSSDLQSITADRIIKKIQETGTFCGEVTCCRKDGSEVPIETTAKTIYDHSGNPIGFVGIHRDITERKRAEEQREQLIREQVARLEAEEQGRKSAFLAEASKVLASSLDYEITLANMAKLAVPYIADWCAVDILDENQVIRRVAIAHLDPSKVELAWKLNRLAPDNLNQSTRLPTVLRTGESAIATEISESSLVAAAKDAEHLELLRSLGLNSLMIVPLLARGRTLGAITFVTAESGRCYTPADLPLVEDLARRAALAVDNARLYRQTREARQIAEEAAERNATLQAVTAALSEALTPAQVAQVVVTQGRRALDACAGFIALMTDNDETLEVVQALGYPQEMLDTGTLYPLTVSVPLTDAVRTGKPLLIESRAIWAERYPQIVTKYDHNAWADIPLIIEGRTVGGMSFSFHQARQFSKDDCAFMLALAQQSAQAIERARAYAAERQARADSEAARSAAETANRTKDEFLATLSHELRTPLNAMLGWTQLLLSRKFDEAKMVRALETIDRNTKSLAALIEDILDVSRIMTGKLHLSVRACELFSVIEAAIEAVRPAAEAKTIQIECVLDSSVGPVWGDANRLQQVVWNLLSNAIKFTPSGGQVTVKLERITGDLTGNAYAQIQVSDTGKGISPDFLPYVFERFRQENSTSTRLYGGLGLGLALVRYLVELHGGTVQASSPGEGLGATFRVQLPLWAVRSKSKPQPSVQPAVTNTVPPDNLPALNGLRVLIVDDEADARDLLATILEQSGAQVTAAACATEAFDFLSQSRVDVLVSDIAMPIVDGYALIRQVRELEAERGEYIPAVALTAYARESDRTSALEAGFQVHLAKPYDPDELVNVVAKLAGCKPKSLSI